KTMRLFRNLIPGIRCVFTASGKQLNSPPRFIAEGIPHLFTPEEWGDIYQLFRSNFQIYPYPTSPGHDFLWMRKRFSQTNLWGAMLEGFGRFLKIPVKHRDVLFTWFPLFGSDPSGACPEGAASIDASFGRTTLFSPRIKGALFLTVTPEQIDPDSGKLNLIRYLSRRGCAIALLPTHPKAGAGSFLHPVFRCDPALSSCLRNPGLPDLGWEIQEGSVTLDQPYRIIAARRVVPLHQPTGVRFNRHWFTAALWVLSGLLACKFGRDVISNRRLPRLHTQLTAAFAFVLLPILFMAILVLERTAEEHTLKEYTDNLSVLNDTLDKTDRHREYIQAWATAVMKRLFRRKALLDELAMEEQKKVPSQ
ncbi:MAG TPA: hypothetical protein PKM25_19710, partial [Candidatus Ozemobacteraceae bacterium]|nr:hypothetical protein [Candidatus Ozemobacteraceae bacterium]